MSADSSECDVIIVGLGPTGAILANILGQYGWSVVALERDIDVYFAPRAVHMDDEVMRVFQAVGLADEIATEAESFEQMEFLLKPGGRPALTSRVGSQDQRYGYAGAWWFYQPTLERQLRNGMQRFKNVEALYGKKVTRVDQDDNGVTVEAVNEDGHSITVTGRYLVGCDGGGSFVRRSAGLSLASSGFDESWVVVDAKTRSGEKDSELPANHQQICDPDQPTTYVPGSGCHYRWEFMVTGDQPEDLVTDPAFVNEQLRQFIDPERLEVMRIARYTFHGVWAERWRNDRILLAGDAAHQMPPFLGQGMCSGVRDAHGLGWRLDMMLSGRCNDHILESWEIERSRHVRDIIRGAVLIGNVVQTRNRLVAWARNSLLFWPSQTFAAVNQFFYRNANRKGALKHGLIGNTRKKLAGHLAIQPKVCVGSKPALMDEALGTDFAILSRRGSLEPFTLDLERLGQSIPLRHVEFDQDGDDSVVGDSDSWLQQWFDSHNVDFVLLRPDRYIYDAGVVNDFPQVVELVINQFGAAVDSSVLAVEA